MAKRLTDTEIWNKDWYLDLSIKKKLLLKYIFDNCDCAGIYEISFRNLRNCFNEEIKKEDFEDIKMIKFIDENKIFIEEFIKFQYGVDINGLKPKNSVHKGVLRCLEKHKLLLNPFETVKNKNKNKDKDKDKNKDKNQNKNQISDLDIKNHINSINSDMKNNNNCNNSVTNNIKNNINPLNSDSQNNDNHCIKTAIDIKNHIGCIDFNMQNNNDCNADVTNDIKNNNDSINNSIKNNDGDFQDHYFDIKNNNKTELKYKFEDLKFEMLKEYENLCPHLIKISGEAESKRTDDKIKLYLKETKNDMELYKQLCREADKLKKIGTINIDFETMLNCRIGILNGKYKDSKTIERERIEARAKRELLETKKLLAEYKNFKGDPMPESFKKLGEKLRSMK